MQTVVETAAFLSDARSLGLPDAERLAIVTWIAANPAAGKPIEGTGGARKVRFAGKARERVAATGLSHSLPGRTSGFPTQHLCEERENRFGAERAACFEIGPDRYSRDL